MQKLLIVTFALGMVALGALADFGTKWAKADGPYSVSDYLNSFSKERAAKEAAAALTEARRQPMSTYMPAAPAGWTRLPWSPDAEEAMDGKRELSEMEQELMDDIMDSPLGKMGVISDQPSYPGEAQRSVVYVKGDEILILSGKVEVDDPLRVRSSVAADMLRSTLNAPNRAAGFAHARGVSWAQKGARWGQEFTHLMPDGASSGDAPDPAGTRRTFQTRMGERVRLEIRARASDPSVREIIQAIDYVTLNALNDAPMPGVLAEQEPLTVEQQVFVAQRWSDQRHRQRIQQRATAVAKFDKGDYTPTFLEQMITPGGAEYRHRQEDGEIKHAALETKAARAPVEEAVSVQAAAEPEEKKGGLSLLSLFGGGDKEAEEQAEAEAAARAADVALASARAHVARLGLTGGDLRVAQDGQSGKPMAEWKAANGGGLKSHHPRFELRSHETQRGLPPGSCLQLVSGKIYCEANAEAIRLAAANMPVGGDTAAVPASPADLSIEEERAAVKVNRFSTSRKKSSGCGAGTFCRVGN